MAIVSPPARTRSPVVVSPPARVREVVPATNPWHIPHGARPLGVLQKTHNGYNAGPNDIPDPRFKPLLIVMNPAWKQRLPENVGYRFERALKYSADDVAKLTGMAAANDYITEYGLRHKLRYRGLPDSVYDALRARVLGAWDSTEKDDVIHPGTKAMMTRTEDGDLLVDLNKNSGPFYCDSLLGIEHHYKAKLTPLA